MSWHFSQAMEGAYLRANCLDGELFAQWKSMPIAQDDSCSGKMKDICHLSPFGMMYVLSTDGHGAELLTWFRADSHAPIFPYQEMDLDWMEKQVDSGWKCSASFAKLDHDLHIWKTRQCSLLEDWEEFLETWPRWGSMHDGECSAQPMPDWIISEKESGLWPTPTASDAKGSPLPETAKKRALKSSRGVRLPEYLTRKGLLHGGLHNPEFSEWLMGWPESWSAIEPLAMDKFQSWLQQHGEFLAENEP